MVRTSGGMEANCETIAANVKKRNTKTGRRFEDVAKTYGAGNSNPMNGWLSNKLRPYLPANWQYGIRWKFFSTGLKGLPIGAASYIIYQIKYKDEDAIKELAAQYKYVRDPSGRVVDVAYAPLVDAGSRARRRTELLRMRELSDEEAERDRQASKAGTKL